MSTFTNREKNILHEARNDARVRPATPPYNFEDLSRVVRSWVTGSSIAQEEEVYSPYHGA
jgi:hypothetical protein